MMTLAVGLMVEQILLLIFGSEARNVPSLIESSFNFGGVLLSGQRLLAFFCSVAILGGLWLFMQHTRLGVGDPCRLARS